MKYHSMREVLEAVQMTEERWIDNFEWPEWLNEARWVTTKGIPGSFYTTKEGELFLNTIRGPVTVSVGDWIIKGSDGELHLCSDSAFRAEYEELHAKVCEEVCEEAQKPEPTQLELGGIKGMEEAAWLNIYCTALAKPDTLSKQAIDCADNGLAAFRARFR